MMKRTYQFKSVKLRDNVDLRDFEPIIKAGFRGIRPDIRVEVVQNRYVIYGNITNSELRKIGKRICANHELGQLCNRYKTSTQLFVCVNPSKCKKDSDEAYRFTFWEQTNKNQH